MSDDFLSHLRHRPGTYAAALVESHRTWPDRSAFVRPDGTSLTYREVAELSARILAALQSRGVDAGSRVLLAMDNTVEALIVERAVMLAGLVRVAVSSRLHSRELEWIAADCSAAVVFVQARHINDLDARIAEISFVAGDPDHPRAIGHLLADRPGPSAVAAREGDPAALMYTSGTTGRPKGAITDQAAWWAMAHDVARLLQATPDDVVLHVAPFSHFSGSVASGFIIRGAAVSAVTRFAPAAVLDQARDVGATCVPLVPTMIGDLMAVPFSDDAWRESAIRIVPYGGSTIDPGLLSRAVGIMGPDRLAQFYGASEALIPTLFLSPDEHRVGSWAVVPAGRPQNGDEIRISTGERDAGADRIGELVVRGPRVMRGYWLDEARTHAVLDDEGWYRTGDVGQIAADGLVTIVGRTREVIISGGFNIYPGEVERVIRTVEGVVDVSVVGCPHDRWGEAVAAAVVPVVGSPITSADVVAACTQELASYKKPVVVRFVDALPLTSTGKIDVRAVERIMGPAPGGG